MVEKAKGLCLSRAKRNEYGEASKYVTFSSTSKGRITDGKVKVTINEKAIEEDLKLAGYNLEPAPAAKIMPFILSPLIFLQFLLFRPYWSILMLFLISFF